MSNSKGTIADDWIVCLLCVSSLEQSLFLQETVATGVHVLLVKRQDMMSGVRQPLDLNKVLGLQYSRKSHEAAVMKPFHVSCRLVPCKH